MIQIGCQVLYRIDPSCSEERFRMFLGEFTLVVCFIAGAFTPSDPNRVTAWLNLWSLYAYCFHVMWYRLFGSPYGAIITFAGIPMFYFMTAASKPKESQEPKEPKDSKPPEHPQNHNFKPLPPKPWKSTWSMHGPLRTLPAF